VIWVALGVVGLVLITLALGGFVIVGVLGVFERRRHARTSRRDRGERL